MGKKKEKGKKRKDSGNPADALRDAVERTFAGAAGVPAGAQKRVQELFDDVTSTLTRLRDAVDERRVLETLETLREQVDGLAKRVAALERGGKSSAAPKATDGAGTANASSPEAKPAGSRARSASAGGTTTKRSASGRAASGTTRSRSTTGRAAAGTSPRSTSSRAKPGTTTGRSSRAAKAPVAADNPPPPTPGTPSTSADGTTDGSGTSGTASS